MNQYTDVVLLTLRLIVAGVVLQAEKNTARTHKAVTVGTWFTATDPETRYACVVKAAAKVYLNAVGAAKHFVAEVGRELAWQACQRGLEALAERRIGQPPTSGAYVYR